MNKLWLLSIIFACATPTFNADGLEKDPIPLAKDLLTAIRDNEDYEQYQEDLANLDAKYLADALPTDEHKLAFWLNIYNAYIQSILMETPELFENRGDFFGEPRVTIAGEELSFDDIEHGIIRSSQNKLGGGFLGKLFVGKYEKMMRTEERDGRIHFALNCGAKDCPPVAVYEYERLNEQLDASSKRFLTKTTEYDKEKKVAKVTPLFSWFRGDFGGLDGVPNYLQRYGIIEPGADPELEFKEYDWTLDLGNYIEL